MTDNTPQKAASRRSFLTFLRGFLARPREVGSVVPSSGVLESRLSSLACLQYAKTVVELGPGTGGTTRALLTALPTTSRLLCVEVNPIFLENLRAIEDSRLDVQEGDALELRQILNRRECGSPDVIVSGVPFSTMTRESGHHLISEIHKALAPGGTFVAYQLSDRVQKLAEAVFGKGETTLVLRNLPPLRITCWKKSIEEERDPGTIRKSSRNAPRQSCDKALTPERRESPMPPVSRQAENHAQRG